MNTIELIRKKRNGESLLADEITFLVDHFTRGKIPDYQFSAFLMAVYLNGMTTEETAALTSAMLHSGTVVNLSSVKGIKVDKHSTGGVGDKTSLILAPIVASFGVPVPMISGRGLGHTGGTLDKLEAIPGFSTNASLAQYKKLIAKNNCALIGQTKEIAPADKLIYALRDVTATVESIPLITASIMSKKLAEGIDALVLDIKTGSGAFMKDPKDAEKLAISLIHTARSFGKKVTGFITDMSQPLGNYIGNQLEVIETVEVLLGRQVTDLCVVSFVLAAEMLVLSGKAKTIDVGLEMAKQSIKDGSAYNTFLRIVKAQGGDTTVIKNPLLYPQPKIAEVFSVPAAGYLQSVDTYEIGMAALELGAGRLTKDDVIDPKAGIIFHKKIGDPIAAGETIATVFTDKKKVLPGVMKRLNHGICTGTKKVKAPELVKKILR